MTIVGYRDRQPQILALTLFSPTLSCRTTDSQKPPLSAPTITQLTTNTKIERILLSFPKAPTQHIESCPNMGCALQCWTRQCIKEPNPLSANLPMIVKPNYFSHPTPALE